MRWYRAAAATLLVAVAALSAALTIGPLASVTTYGISMEPRFRTGDLAIVRSSSGYEVGDVTAYRSEAFDRVVMHRIVAVEDGHYTLQGDNNSWLDPETPTRDDLIGKLVFRIPQGGLWLDRLTDPVPLGLIAFGLLAGGGTAVQTRHTRRRRMMSSHARRNRATPSLTALPHQFRTAGATAAVAGLLGLGLGALAWSGPVEQVTTAEEESAREVTFSYSADVPPSPAYDDTTVTSPLPVFRKLAETVDVRFDYQGGGPGRVSVDAQLSTPNGWRSTVPLAPGTAFTEETYTGTVRLDLADLTARAKAAADVTGMPADQLTVAVVAHITTGAGDDFAPELRLGLTPLQLTLVGDPAALTVKDPAPVQTVTAEPRTLSLFGRELGVAAVRTSSLVLLLGALVGAAVLGVAARRSAPSTEAEGIRRRYAPVLVRVLPMPTPPGRPVVDVTDFATLAKLAERYGLLVLHWSRSEVATFVVQDEGTTYRYRTGTGVVPEAAERDDVLDPAPP